MKTPSDEKIKLDSITVRYGETTLRELLRAGYSVAPKPAEYSAETQTTLVAFFSAGKPMGMLRFMMCQNRSCQVT